MATIQDLENSIQSLITANTQLATEVQESVAVLGSLARRASIDPSTRTDGSPLETGDEYFNTISNSKRRYVNGSWVNIEDQLIANVEAAGEVKVAAAEAAKVSAEVARDAAQLSAGVFVDTAAGLAATTSGKYFSVPSAESSEFLVLYRNNSGMAQEVKRYPSANQIAELVERMQGDVRFVSLAHESGYVLALVDKEQRAALLVKQDGTVYIPKASIPALDELHTRVAPLEGLPPRVTALEELPPRVTTLEGLMPQVMSPESGYAWALVDNTGRAAILVTATGEVQIPSMLASLDERFAALDTRVAANEGKVGLSISNESGYAYALVDSQGRIGFGIKLDGTLVGKFPLPDLNGKFVGEGNLLDPLRRRVMPYKTDVVATRGDDWRATFGQVAVRTAAGDGSVWERFPHFATDNLRGVNNSGTSLRFRRSSGLPIRGKRYGGTYNPGAVASVTNKGTFTATDVWPPSGTFSTGDYYQYRSSTSRSIDGATVRRSDLMVYDGAGWVHQPAPGAGGTQNERDWWSFSTAGTFDGTAYAAGERIVCLGVHSMSGTSLLRWYKDDPKKGDLFYRGEFAPSGGLPATPTDGEVYQASAAGSAGGFTFAEGDYLVRESGVWGQVATEQSVQVDAGAFVSLRCSVSASEWEVRRADKSAAMVGVILGSKRGTVPIKHEDSLTLYSDSMFGSGGVGTLIINKVGRGGTVNAFGGGSSRNILSMVEREIAVLGDRYRGNIHLFWHGQNNQPSNSTDANAAQIREVSLRLADLAGVRDPRFLFLSVLGQRACTWNGERIVVTQHERMFNKEGPLYDLEQWYAATFPGQWISTRLALLASADGTPDPTFPGMTEKQVADTYGIVPFSHFYGSTWPVQQASLVYRGTWNTANLPTGGNPNDYYLRIGGGTVGALLINESGTWVERAPDVTHINTKSAEVLATAIFNLITSNNW